MKGDEVFSRDARDGLKRAFPPEGVIGPKQEFPELAGGDARRILRSTANGFQRLAFRHLHLSCFECGRSQDIGKNGQPSPEILLEHIQCGRPAFGADDDGYGRGEKLKLLVDLISGHARSPTGSHHRAHDARQPDLVFRLIHGSCTDHRRDGRERQLGIRQEVHNHAVFQDDAFDLRSRKGDRIEFHRARVERRSGPRGGLRQGGCAEDQAESDDAEHDVHYALIHG